MIQRLAAHYTQLLASEELRGMRGMHMHSRGGRDKEFAEYNYEYQKEYQKEYKEYDCERSGYSLVSPTSYHSLQAQLIDAFPEFDMVSSHHNIDTKMGMGMGMGMGGVKIIQLFCTLPQPLCADIHR
jgi:hypothetical protein